MGFANKCLIGFVLLTGFLWKANAQDPVYSNKLIFNGNKMLESKSLLKQMNTKPRTVPDKLTFWKKRTEFSHFMLEEDILRLEKHYQYNGFLKPKVTYQLLPRKKKKKLDIHIKVEEGHPILIDQLEFKLSENNECQSLLDSLKYVIPLKFSSRFRDVDVLNTEKALRNNFSRIGFPFVKIEKDLQLKEYINKVDVIYTVSPGNKSFFGDIKLYGVSFISKSFVTKRIDIKKGEKFSQAKLEEQQERLFDLSVFQYVTIRADLDSVKNDHIPIIIQVKELPRWSFKIGAGYGTEDRIRLSLLLTKLNFLGGGRTLILKAQHSYFFPIDTDIRLIQPINFSRHLDLILNPFFVREREPSYFVNRLGTTLTLQKNFSRKASGYISYTIQNDEVELSENLETPPENLDNNKSGITLGLNLNATNNIFTPDRGVKFESIVNYTGIGFKTEVHYYKFISTFSFFHRIGKRVVFGAKLKSGVIQATQGSKQTPIEDRYLLGGAMSLRGFGRSQVSPEDENGNKIGGNTMLESSAELRIHLISIFSTVVFFDLGNAWRNSWDYRMKDLLYDTGIGLRIKTPVGPVRLDIATPVVNQDFKLKFFITIGHAF